MAASLWCGIFFASLDLSAQDIDFARDIRPILSENCAFCHGPDEATREAGLRLDTPEGAAEAIEPHRSEESELFRRIASEDADELMPPADSNRSLSPQEIELIRQWIDQGAQWEQHWAFRPLTAPEIPAASDPHPTLNPIDAFVHNTLAQQGLQPAPAAPRTTLIRRLTLDLTGLPPTPAEVDAFVADTSADAYEKVVDRLLDSPAYGQRMAWNWLDAARYADTNGYQGDNERTMWPWRDWVVRAFNENLPYDEFTRWQIAGDLMPQATSEQILATGFLRNHMINGEGGRIAEENRVEYVMDMTETVGTVWLGLTLNCCRCHDHKYDPVTNQEYYQFFAFFNQTPVNGSGGDPQAAPNLVVTPEQEQEQLAALDEQLATLDQQLQTLSESLQDQQDSWEQAERNRLMNSQAWQSLHADTATATGSQLEILEDNSILSVGETAPDKDTYTIYATTNLPRITALRLEALRHPSLHQNSLSRADSGNFVLTEIEISQVAGDADEGTPVAIADASATFEQGSHAVKNAFDKNATTGWAVYEGGVVDREHAAVFRFEQPLEPAADARLKIVLRHDSPHVRHNIGRFRLSLTAAEEPQVTTSSEKLLAALETPSESRDAAQKQLVQESHRESVPQYRTLQQQREKLAAQRDSIQKSLPKVMVMADMEQPRQTFMLQRGLYNKPTDPVVAALPDFLPSPTASQPASGEQQSANRLTLANWLVDDRNPLTARVTVNRFWQQLFGIGLVKTSEDFGAQGEIPPQMDLLNWLAAHFRDSGWDVKGLMRLIVTSHTYRQSSRVDQLALLEQDPDNRLLARGARYRLPSWMLRDQALAAGGLLSSASSGPSVNTYQPAGVWEEASFGNKVYRQDSGEKLYRRSLYVFWRRIIAPTMFFDSPSRQTCTVNASRTNTPLHALQTLNGTAFVESARALAEATLISDADSDSARLDRVFRQVLARSPSAAEASVLLNGLQRTRGQYEGQAEQAKKLLAIGESPRDESLDAIEHAAWTGLCLAVLNLDETLNRE